MSAEPSLSLPVLGAVEMRLSDDDKRQIADMVAREMAARQGLSDEALSAIRPNRLAELLEVSPGTLITWEREGTLVPFLREGKVVRYSRQQIAALMAGGDR